VERAGKIWGDTVVAVTPVLWKGHTPGHGESEWNAVLANGNWHSFDCNGHPTCHRECDVVSVEVT
jgi:cysteinyl-tRNA synthetase